MYNMHKLLDYFRCNILTTNEGGADHMVLTIMSPKIV